MTAPRRWRPGTCWAGARSAATSATTGRQAPGSNGLIPTGKNRQEQHVALLKQTRKVAGKVDLLFLGDAQIQCWCLPETREVWDKDYAPLKAFNLGMASSQRENVLWRVNDGCLAGLTPKGVVLHAGLHNVWATRCTPRQWVEGIANLVNAVHEQLPEAKILLVGITPSGEKGTVYRKTPREVNKELAKFDKGDTVRYVDVSEKLIPDDGPLSFDVYDKNTFNLAKKGYELWAEAMNPLLGEMLHTRVPPATGPDDAKPAATKSAEPAK